MGRLKSWTEKLTTTAKVISALTVISSTIIGLLTFITVKVTMISTEFKKAVAIVPIVEQNTRDIADLKISFRDNAIIANKLEEQQKYIVTEIDMMIDDSYNRIVNKQPLGMKYVNRLVYYRDNLTFLSNKQKMLINHIERVADKQVDKNIDTD